MKLESLFIELANILTFSHFLQIFFKLYKFIILSRVVRQDGYAIFKLEDIRIWSIIHQNHTIQISIDDS